MKKLSERTEPLKAGLKVYFYTQFPRIDIGNDGLSFASCIRGTGKLWNDGDSITGFLTIKEVEDLVRGSWHGEVCINWDDNKNWAYITTEYYCQTVGVIQSLLIEKQGELDL